MSDQGSEGLFSPFLKNQRLKKIRKYIKGRVLDFGCGTGDLGQYCVQSTYLGFDIDAQSLSIAKEKYPHLTFTEHFPLLNSLNEEYDSIILSALIEHVDDPTSLIIFLKKYLAKDGHVVITTPHPSFGWIHQLGASLGLFSAEASKEHKTLLGKVHMNMIALKANLIMVIYERFLFGANQLIILKSQS